MIIFVKKKWEWNHFIEREVKKNESQFLTNKITTMKLRRKQFKKTKKKITQVCSSQHIGEFLKKKTSFEGSGHDNFL
jgi:hypothetical protein